MSSEELIGELFKTKIPGLDQDADIQEALRIYHYGAPSSAFDINETNPENLPNPSIARKLYETDNQIQELIDLGVGSVYSATEPEGPPNGLIWVKAETVALPFITKNQSFYQELPPSEEEFDLVEGMTWISKEPHPKLYVYDLELGWLVVGLPSGDES